MKDYDFIDIINKKFDYIFAKLDELEQRKFKAPTEKEIDDILKYLSGKFSSQREIDIVRESLIQYRKQV